MPRRARVVIPDTAHHITQRGNNRQNVLIDDQDFKKYCYLMNKYTARYGVDVLAYCLMNNHVHLILVPKERESIAFLLRALHMRYTQYANYKRRISGHLWQGRYYSCVVGESHLYYAMRYVEQNPVRARMVNYPWEYPWSSARRHLRKPIKTYIKVKETSVVDKKDWKMYLINKDPDIDEQLRKGTSKGRAFAEEGFIRFWETKLNCVLGDRKPGRKKK